ESLLWLRESDRMTVWRVVCALVFALLLAPPLANPSQAQGVVTVDLEPVAATPGWYLVEQHGFRFYVLPGDGCPDAHGGAVELTTDDQGVPWLVFGDVGERCPISQQVEAA